MRTELVAFDNLMISNYKRCPRFFYHRHIECIQPVGKNFGTDFKAQFGVAWHDAMDAWYLSNGSPDVMDKAFIKTWMPFEGTDSTGLRTLARGLKLLQHYRTQYPIEDEPFTIPSPEYIEVGFSVQLGDFIYCGRMDKLAKWRGPGMEGWVVIDHKTSGAKGYLTLKPNAALDGYVWGAGQLVDGPIIGGYLDQVYLYKVKIEMYRELTERKLEEIEEWKWETIRWVSKIREDFNDKRWSRNPGNCKAFGRECEYKLLCSNCNLATIEQLKETMYDVDVWSPYPDKDDSKD